MPHPTRRNNTHLGIDRGLARRRQHALLAERQLDRHDGADTGSSAHVAVAARARGAVPDTRQAEVTRPACLVALFGGDPAPVVAYLEAEARPPEVHLDLDVSRLGVPHRIGDRLTTDAEGGVLERA